MTSRTRAWAVSVLILASLATLGACVGDEPAPLGATPTNDAGVDGATSSTQPAGALTVVAVPSVSLLPSTTVTIEVTVERKGGFAGPVKLSASKLPGGVTAEPVTVTQDQTAGTLTLIANATPVLGVTVIEISAAALDETIGAKADVQLVVRGAPGTLDTSFASTGIVADLSILAADGVFLKDGRIVVAGSTTAESGYGDDYGAVRLTPDGKVDTTFAKDGVFRTTLGVPEIGSQSVAKALLGEDEKISIIGQAADSNKELRFGIVRIDKDGTLDPLLGKSGVGPVTGAARDGGNVGSNTFLMGFAAQFIGGKVAIGKVGPTGFDATFGTDGVVIDSTRDIVKPSGIVQPNGKILVGGASGSPGVDEGLLLLRYNADGTVDQTFATGGAYTVDYTDSNESVEALAMLDQGRILVVGIQNKPSVPFVKVLTQQGQVDASFVTTAIPHVGDVGVNNVAREVAVQEDGAIVFSGLTVDGGVSRLFLMRLLKNGVPDPAFHGGAGLIIKPMGLPSNTNFTPHKLAIDSHNRLVIFSSRAILRYWL